MRRLLILLFLLAVIAVVAPKGLHKGPERPALANGTVSDFLAPARAGPRRAYPARLERWVRRAGQN